MGEGTYMFSIAIDPGHGGKKIANGSTPNCIIGPNGLLEKDVTLLVAQAAAVHLRAFHFKVMLTREDDINRSIEGRTDLSRDFGSDVFVSLHLNGSHDPSVDGTEIYVSPSAGKKEHALAFALLNALCPITSGTSNGVFAANLSDLQGDYHLARTVPCHIEIAYLTHPDQARRLTSDAYIDQLGSAIASGINTFSKQSLMQSAVGLSSLTEEQIIYQVKKSHRDPPNKPIDLPQPGKGEDTIRFTVPGGLKLSRWEVEVKAQSPGAGYKVKVSPKNGSTGKQLMRIHWWHPPYGKIKFDVRIYASVDGKANPSTIKVDSSGWIEYANNIVDQGIPVKFVIKGQKAKLLAKAINKKHNESRAQAKTYGQVWEEVVLGLGIVALISLVIIVGMVTFSKILITAMDKGYDIKDSGYSVAAGEGASRQEHKMSFTLAPTRPA